MPALGLLIYNIIAGIAAFLVRYLTQKAAVGLAMVGLFTALMIGIHTGLHAAIKLAMVGVGSVHPMFAVGLGVVISPQTQKFISAYFLLYSACELYKWKVNLMFLWHRY